MRALDYPSPRATSSLPIYPASRHRFCTGTSLFGWVTVDSRRHSSSMLSCWFAALTTIDKGTPRSSTRTFRLVPFFPPVGRVFPNRLLRHRRLDVGAIGCLPFPGDPLHLVIFSQPPAPELHKETHRRPVLKLTVNRRRSQTAELLPWQCVPDGACARRAGGVTSPLAQPAGQKDWCVAPGKTDTDTPSSDAACSAAIRQRAAHRRGGYRLRGAPGPWPRA